MVWDVIHLYMSYVCIFVFIYNYIVLVSVYSPLIDTQDGVTSLMLAASEGRTDVVEELIRQGGDVNVQDKVRCLRGYCRQWSRREEVSWRCECVPVG